jgi:hypothetical protein
VLPRDPFSVNQCVDLHRNALNRRGLGGLGSVPLNGRLEPLLGTCSGISETAIAQIICMPCVFPPTISHREQLLPAPDWPCVGC